jgi:hypothetical protein
MILTVLAILLVIAALVWFLFVRQPGPSRSQRRPAAVTSAPRRPGGIDKLADSGLFWGVELADTGCETARGLQGQQYSFETAPELPLPGCGSAACTCQFHGLRERRSQVRRTHPDRREVVRFDVDNPDRRARVSRRRGDKWADHTY